MNLETDTFKVIEASVGHDNKPMLGTFPFAKLDIPKEIQGEGWEYLTGHCNSNFLIELKVPAEIVGFLNGSAKHDPLTSAVFYVWESVDGADYTIQVPVGFIYGPYDTVAPVIKEPGQYRLCAFSLNVDWKHAGFAIRPTTSAETVE